MKYYYLGSLSYQSVSSPRSLSQSSSQNFESCGCTLWRIAHVSPLTKLRYLLNHCFQCHYWWPFEVLGSPIPFCANLIDSHALEQFHGEINSIINESYSCLLTCAWLLCLASRISLYSICFPRWRLCLWSSSLHQHTILFLLLYPLRHQSQLLLFFLLPSPYWQLSWR